MVVIVGGSLLMNTDYSRFVNPSITKSDFSGFFFTKRYFSRMDTFSEDFKAWMDVKQFTAETLSPVIGKSAGTIANWRSIGVPERSSVRQFLTDFMASYKPPVNSPEAETIILRIEFDDEELDLVSTAAGIVDTPIREFIRRAAVHQARIKEAESIAAKTTSLPAPKAHILAAAGSPLSAEVTDWDGTDDTMLGLF